MSSSAAAPGKELKLKALLVGPGRLPGPHAAAGRCGSSSKIAGDRADARADGQGRARSEPRCTSNARARPRPAQERDGRGQVDSAMGSAVMRLSRPSRQDDPHAGRRDARPRARSPLREGPHRRADVRPRQPDRAAGPRRARAPRSRGSACARSSAIRSSSRPIRRSARRRTSASRSRQGTRRPSAPRSKR